MPLCTPERTVLSAMIGTKPPIARQSSQELFQPHLECDPKASGQAHLRWPTRFLLLLVATAILISGASPTFAQRSQLGGPEHIAGTKWLYDVSKDVCYYEPSVGSYLASQEALHLRQNRWLWNKGYSEAEQGFDMLGLTHNVAAQCGAVGKMLALGLMPALLQGIFGQVDPELNQAIDRLRNGGGRPGVGSDSTDERNQNTGNTSLRNTDTFYEDQYWKVSKLHDAEMCAAENKPKRNVGFFLSDKHIALFAKAKWFLRNPPGGGEMNPVTVNLYFDVDSYHKNENDPGNMEVSPGVLSGDTLLVVATTEGPDDINLGSNGRSFLGIKVK